MYSADCSLLLWGQRANDVKPGKAGKGTGTIEATIEEKLAGTEH